MKLLDGVIARAQEAVPARRTEWAQVAVSPEAIIFHTPDQLRAFVEAEIRRAFEVCQIPRPSSGPAK